MRHLLALLTMAFLAACAPAHPNLRPEPHQEAAGANSGEPSLFPGDASVLSDEAIAKILQHRYRAPRVSRIALLPFGWARWSGWSEQLAVVTDEINAEVLAILRSSRKVYDAAILPSILVPEKRTVGHLREAAARFQADLLLVFRSACESFEKYRLFRANQVKGYCHVEAVLLDVRTGIVPLVASSLKNFGGSQEPGDFDLREAVLRSQLTALAALGEISRSVVSFLEKDSN
jgi:hypothetical protein